MRHGGIYHVPQVVQFMAQFLVLHPTALPRPRVRALGIHGTRGVQVAVRLLRGGHNDQHAVYVPFQLLVRIRLQHVGGTLDGFIHIRIVKGKTLYLIAQVHGRMHLLLCLDEVLITALTLTFGEGQRDGDLAGGFEALSPKRVRRNFYAGERDRADGIAGLGGWLRKGRHGGRNQGHGEKERLGHHLFILI